MTARSLEAALADAAGDAAILDRTAYGPWLVAGVEPAAVVQPATAGAVAAVLAVCAERGVPVEPAGAGTALGQGPEPAVAPVVVSTRRLTGLTEYEPADLVVGVRAGTPLRTLQDELRRNGQWLPLDPPAGADATVGAVLSLAAAGPLRARHGTPRDFVLGVEVATGDGRLLRFGGRVVKNVAGYDVPRLLVGSRGTLGIITGAFLLLRSEPAEDLTLLLPASGPAEAARHSLAVRSTDLAEAVEVLAPALAEACSVGGGWMVAVRVRGFGAGVAAARRRLEEVTGRHGDTAPTDLWDRLCALEASSRAGYRLSGPPVALGTTLDVATRLAGAAAGWMLAGHGADGIVRLWCADSAGSASSASSAVSHDPDEAALLASAQMAEMGGTLQAYDAPPPPAAGPVAAIAGRVRHAFDPAGVMSPRRTAVALPAAAGASR